MKVRNIEEADRPTIEKWIEEDEFHKGQLTADDFYKPEHLYSAFDDEEGPVCFLRMTKVLRIGPAQFCTKERERNHKIVVEAIPAIVNQAREAGFDEIIFSSDSPGLKGLLCRLFGFSKGSETFRLVIPR